MDIKLCGLLKVQVISTDNYPLNVNVFQLFTSNGKLETNISHPFDSNRVFILTFDFVHILKSIRNNWLNQKDFDKTFHFPYLGNLKVDYCDYPLKFGCASIQDVHKLYHSERTSLAMLAPNS